MIVVTVPRMHRLDTPSRSPRSVARQA